MTEPSVSVVIVDDDLAVRRGLTRLLKVSGYDVEAFASGRAFLERGDYGRVTCLLLDVRMPGQSGLDVQRLLVGAGYDIPIIFMGAGLPPGARLTLNGGAVEFITKPFDDTILLDAVRRAVVRGRQLPLPQTDGRDPSPS